LACSQPIRTESEPAADDLHLGAEGSNLGIELASIFMS